MYTARVGDRAFCFSDCTFRRKVVFSHPSHAEFLNGRKAGIASRDSDELKWFQPGKLVFHAHGMQFDSGYLLSKLSLS